MRRKFTGMLRLSSGIDDRRRINGLSATLFRFNTDPSAEGGAGGGSGSGDTDPGKGDDKSKAGGKQKTAEELAAELEETRKALSKSNKDAADHRKKLEAFEKAEAEKAEAEKTEAQKLKDRAEKAEAMAKAAADALTQRDINDAIRDAARDAGFIDPSDALQLVDRTAITISDGVVSGAADAVKALAKAKAHLIKAATDPNKRAATPGTPKTNNNGKQPETPANQDMPRSARI